MSAPVGGSTGAELHISEGATGHGGCRGCAPSSESKLDAGVSFHQHLVIPDCIPPAIPIRLRQSTSATTKTVPAAYLVPIRARRTIRNCAKISVSDVGTRAAGRLG